MELFFFLGLFVILVVAISNRGDKSTLSAYNLSRRFRMTKNAKLIDKYILDGIAYFTFLITDSNLKISMQVQNEEYGLYNVNEEGALTFANKNGIYFFGDFISNN